MKIVYLSSSTIPSRTANSIHVMKMCQAFANNGHEVVIVAPDRKDGLEPNVKDVFAYYGVDKCFELVKLPCRNIKGTEIIYGMSAGLKSRTIKPDLVYCRDIRGAFFAAKFGLPVIFESHMPSRDSGLFSKYVFPLLIKSPQFIKLIVITNALRKHYEKNYPQIKDKIMVAPDGADPVPENVQAVELPGTKERLQVGYLGHLYKGKGMEVISRLAPLCSWADFHVMGGTDKDIQNWKDKCQSLKNIAIHGFIPHGEIQKYIKTFDVVLLPNQKHVSIHDCENKNISCWTSPLKIFEYMAAGKPIISSDLPVLREVLEHDRNALLCPPKEVEAWKQALEKLAKNQELAEKIARAAFHDFIRNYTWKARAKRVLNVCFPIKRY